MGTVRLAARGVNFSVDQAGPDTGDSNALSRNLVADVETARRSWNERTLYEN